MKYAFPLIMFFFWGCGLDSLVFTAADQEPLPVLPNVQPNVLAGYVTSLPGASVSLIGLSGQELASVQAGEDGAYGFELAGNTDFSGMHVVASAGSRQYWALAPLVPAQDSVLNGIRTVPMSLVPGMDNLSPTSTALAFILLHRSSGAPLSAEAATNAANAALTGLSSLPEVLEFANMVERIIEATSPESTESPLAFDPAWSGTPGTSPLNDGFIANGFDYGGEGQLENTSDLFDAALQAASDSLNYTTCTPENWIRVVFMVDLSEGLQDGNCDPLNPFLWASDAPGKTVYFTGGIHVSTPQCDGSGSEACMDESTLDSSNLELSAWEPNVVPMYDDGTHGDAVNGDGIWTRAFTLPWIPLESEGAFRGIRIGYKYTYGQGGALWTDTEEWPGNQRILEVADLNGDGLVVRYDRFGDEASNKDKKNLLTFSNGGCGTNSWPEENSANCHSDVWENTLHSELICGEEMNLPVGAIAPVTCVEATVKSQENAP